MQGGERKYGYLFLLMHLSKTNSTVVYYDPSWLRDTITQAWTQDKERKVGTGEGKWDASEALCHKLLVKEIEVKQMKWPTERKLLVYAKLAPNKQTRGFWININKATGGMTQISTRSILMAELSWFFMHGVMRPFGSRIKYDTHSWDQTEDVAGSMFRLSISGQLSIYSGNRILHFSFCVC